MKKEVFTMSTDERIQKRQKVSVQNPLDLPELRDHIFSYFDTKDLCKWDLICKQNKESNQDIWRRKSHERFGTSLTGVDGKFEWRRAMGFMKDPILYQLEDSGDFGAGEEPGGSLKVVTNQNVIAYATDDDSNRSWNGLTHDNIYLRSARTLNFIEALESAHNCWNITICGKQGCEIYVISNPAYVSAVRCRENMMIQNLSQQRNERTIPILGCNSHLIVLVNTSFVLYKVNVGQEGQLLEYRQTISISDRIRDEPIYIETELNLEWSPCGQYFAVYHPNIRKIYLWKFDREKESLEVVKQYPTNAIQGIKGILITESFLVLSLERKCFCVLDRKNGEIVHSSLTDKPNSSLTEEEEEEDDEFSIYPLTMKVLSGDLIVTSSYQGHALCIWNLRQGQLLKRHAHAFEHFSDEIQEDGVDVTSIMYDQDINTIICGCYGLYAWSFPIDNGMKKRVISIRRRERNILRAVLDFKQGEMKGDDTSF